MLGVLVWQEHCKHELVKTKVNDIHNSSAQTLSSCEVTE